MNNQVENHTDTNFAYVVSINSPGDREHGKKGLAIYLRTENGDKLYRVLWENNTITKELVGSVLQFREKIPKDKLPLKGTSLDLNNNKGGKRRVQKSRRRKLNKRKRTVRKHK